MGATTNKKTTLERACARQAAAFDGAGDAAINDESVGSLPAFAEMARLGFLTRDSQEGRSSRVRGTPKDADLWSRVTEATPMTADEERDATPQTAPPAYVRRLQAAYDAAGGRRGDGRQLEKAYVCGFVDAARAGRVVEDFIMATDKTAWAVTTRRGGREPPDAVAAVRHPLTFTRFDDGALSWHTAAWNSWSARTAEHETAEAGLRASEGPRVAYVAFVDPKAGRDARARPGGLWADVLSALARGPR